ncbi:MAG: cadherin-like beta sandwich domain-containing protein [Chloroflexi bacterium]|nr:cadherin-like beta sandwich domain-containing protein [Chloroflexota bacterium]
MNLEVLRQTLELLEELPAESAVWEKDVPEFLESLTALSASKDAERAAVVSRETLAKSIEDFEGTYSEILVYLEVDTSLWRPPLGADNALIERIDRLFGTLESLFNDYGAIPDKGASLSQTRALIERRQAIEDQIVGISSELDGLLQTVEEITHDGRPPDPVVEITTTDRLIETHTKSSDATLSELRISEGSLRFDPDRTKYEVRLENDIGIFELWPVTNTANATIAVTAESSDDHRADLESEHGGYTVSNLKVGITEISLNVTAEDLSTSKTYYVTVSRAASDNARLKSLDLSIGDLRFDTEVAQYEVQIPWDTEELTTRFSTAHCAATVEASVVLPGQKNAYALNTDGGAISISALPEGNSVLAIHVTAQNGGSTQDYVVTVTRPAAAKTNHVVLMWSLVAQDDLAGAYWLAESLSNQGTVSRQLPSLLMAAQGARWLSHDSMGCVGDLSDIVSETATPFDDDAQVMLGLAAALRPSVVAPETNLLAWLDTPDCLSSVENIVAPIRTFANLGHRLGPEFVRGDEWQGRLEGLIVEASARARAWLEDAEKRRHNLARANSVWRYLCTRDGILGTLHATVGGDVRVEVATARSEVETLRLSPFVDELINETDHSLHPNIRNEIAGAARIWLKQRIAEAVDIAAEWCDLVERANQSSSGTRNQWLSERVAELRSEIAAQSEAVLGDILRVSNDESREDLAAAAGCLAKSVHLLLDYLSIEHDVDSISEPPRVVQDLQMVTRNSANHGLGDDINLAVAISRRLIWMPFVELRDDGKPVDDSRPIDLDLVAPDWFAGDATLEQVTKSRISIGDFRFLDILTSGIANDERSNFDGLFAPEIAAAKETLREHRDRAQTVVDQAVSDGVIEYDGKRWTEVTNVLEDIVVDQVLNFKGAHDKLDWIESTIGCERDSRRKELRTEWEPLIRGLREDPSVLGVIVEELDETFQLASHDASLDIRIMEDCVSRVRNHKSGDGQDLRPTISRNQSEVLENFLAFCEISVDGQTLSQGANRLRSLLRHAES